MLFPLLNILFVRYVIAADYTNQVQESSLHIAKECYVSFRIGLGMPKHSPYKDMVDKFIHKLVEGGFIDMWMKEMTKNARQDNKKVKFQVI